MPYHAWQDQLKEIHRKLYCSLVDDYNVDIATPSIIFFKNTYTIVYDAHYWDNLHVVANDEYDDYLRKLRADQLSRMEYENHNYLPLMQNCPCKQEKHQP